MCEPVSIVSGVLAVGGAVLQHTQQQEAAENANKAAEIQYGVEAARAKAEAQDRQNQLTAESLQESERIGQQRQALALQALQEQASSKVASAEGGIGGVSKIRSFLATDIQEDLSRSDITKGETMGQFNIQQRARGIATAKSTRTQNAFLTRQSNRRRVPGAGDLAVGALTAAGPSIGSGLESTFKESK